MRLHSILIVPVILFMSCNEPTSTATTTARFRVSGNCGLCKKNIEGALKTDGVLEAEWDAGSKQMEVSYDSTKISRDAIHRRIAQVGYDTDVCTANATAYYQLHPCCQYDRK